MTSLVRHTTGIVCAPMLQDRVDTLRLPQMVSDNTDSHATAFTVSVDHVNTGTGVSAADRTATVRALADPATSAGDLARPVTCSRCGQEREACSLAPATPRPHST